LHTHVVSTALGEHQLYQDIGLIELTGISLELGLLTVFKVGSLASILIYCPSVEYPFLSNRFCHEPASVTAAPGAIRGYTISTLQQLAMRLCYERIITHPQLEKIVSSAHRAWPKDRKMALPTHVRQRDLTVILKMLSPPRFIEQSSIMRHISATIYPLKLYIFSVGAHQLKQLACVYGEDDTFITLLLGYPRMLTSMSMPLGYNFKRRPG
jgi:hypothetical protein